MRFTAAAVLLFALISLFSAPVEAGYRSAPRARRTRAARALSYGCGWDASKLECRTKGTFGFGKWVRSVVTDCTPLRDALVRLADNAPAVSRSSSPPTTSSATRSRSRTDVRSERNRRFERRRTPRAGGSQRERTFGTRNRTSLASGERGARAASRRERRRYGACTYFYQSMCVRRDCARTFLPRKQLLVTPRGLSDVMRPRCC